MRQHHRRQVASTLLPSAACAALAGCGAGAPVRAADQTTAQASTRQEIPIAKNRNSGSYPVGLGFMPSGAAVAAYRVAPAKGHRLQTRLVVVRPDGSLASEQTVDEMPASSPMFAADGQGVLLSTVTERRQRLSWSPISADGRLGKATRLSSDGVDPALDVNAKGQAVIAWIDYGTRRPSGELPIRLKVVTRDRTGAFGAPATLRITGSWAADPPAVSAAVSEDGAVSVGFADPTNRGGTRSVRVWRAEAGDDFGAPITVGTHQGGGVSDLAMTPGPGGRVTVLWGSSSIRQGVPSRWQVKLATVLGDGTVTGVKRVDAGEGEAYPDGGLGVATSASGRGLAVWTHVGATGEKSVEQSVWAASIDVDGNVGQSREVAAGALAGSVAAIAGDQFVSTWITQSAPRYVAGISADASTQPIDLGPVQLPGTPAVRFDPPAPGPVVDHQGRPVIAFARRTPASDEFDRLVIERPAVP